MKKLVYRDLRGNNPNKHEVSMEEISAWPNLDTGVINEAKVSRKKIYKCFIREKYISEDVRELRNWICDKKSEGCRKNCHVLRHIDTRTGENKVICKVLGEFFVIHSNTAYRIVYINEIRIQIDE
ncbi:MAG: hypothetical protein KJ864_03755 [Candidatus Omnitrophica bacterium]|nr:hypothetical protein [Candidatus Omnitrophota bacterium]